MKKAVLVFVFFALTGPLAAQVCTVNGNHVSVFHWKASQGTMARYTAGILDTCYKMGVIIFLGSDSLGVYAIESAWEDDARGGSFARLVRTGYDGIRSSSLIYNGDMLEKYLENGDSLRIKQRELILGKMWQFSSKKILPSSLQPLKSRKYKSNGRVEIKIPNENKKLVWQLIAQSQMCWCFYHWELDLVEQ